MSARALARLVLPSTEIGETIEGQVTVGNHQFHFGHVMLEMPIRHRSREAE